MILTLEVSAQPGVKPGVPSRQMFSEAGGTIGRANENSLVLPHGKVSGRHAIISYRTRVFYIEDTSRNGVCVNSGENRLAPGRPYALKAGDRIFIDPYEIYVSIAEERDTLERKPVDESNPFLVADPFVAPSASPFDPSPIPPAAEATSGEELDPLKVIKPVQKGPPIRPAPAAKDLARGSLLEDHYRPPPVVPAPEPPADVPIIPRDYNPLDDGTASVPPPQPVKRVSSRNPDPKPPPAQPVRRPQPPSAVSQKPASEPDAERLNTGADVGASEFANILSGAGLDGALVTPELMRTFGRILRVVVTGLMDVLQARQHIKDEFRMHMTRVRPKDNNPLKLSANVEDALQKLLVNRNPAYLPPVEAFQDAFDDLRNHQMAMLAGLRAAFESMLAEFDPDHLQQQFDRQLNKGALLPMPAKLRYWELYREKCLDMAKDPEASFRELFGEQFAKAYEDQLKRLKADR